MGQRLVLLLPKRSADPLAQPRGGNLVQTDAWRSCHSGQDYLQQIRLQQGISSKALTVSSWAWLWCIWAGTRQTSSHVWSRTTLHRHSLATHTFVLPGYGNETLVLPWVEILGLESSLLLGQWWIVLGVACGTLFLKNNFIEIGQKISFILGLGLETGRQTASCFLQALDDEQRVAPATV